LPGTVGHPGASHGERLAAARAAVASARPVPEGWWLDQAEAGADEAEAALARLARTAIVRAVVGPLTHRVVSGSAAAEQTARLLAAISGYRECRHLQRRHGPGLRYALAGVGVILCRECVGRIPRSPPPGWASTCDLCGMDRPDNLFRYFATALGDVVVMGYAGRCCAPTVLAGEVATW
jgi:hypothetical protein